VTIRQIAPDLWYWTAPHPQWRPGYDWPEQVGCVCCRSPEAVVLIDPLLPRGQEAALWELVDRLGRPVAVLLTAPWHQRDARGVAERYGTTVWAHEAARRRLTFPTRSDRLPDGVKAFAPEGVDEGQVAFYLPAHRALVVAELFIGDGGGLRACPSPSTHDAAAFYGSLRKLLDLPIEHVLVAHGVPVLNDGHRRIAEALGA
jgi:glyoxylase-like metal-dependent hydrolase (beta-lactamase superfamily II)